MTDPLKFNVIADTLKEVCREAAGPADMEELCNTVRLKGVPDAMDTEVQDVAAYLLWSKYR